MYGFAPEEKAYLGSVPARATCRRWFDQIGGGTERMLPWRRSLITALPRWPYNRARAEFR
jgi:hypothetical protein